MSRREDIEQALVDLLEGAITGLAGVKGSIPDTRAEGKDRYAAVGFIGAEGERLNYGQNTLEESYQTIVWWPNSVTRDDALTEWEAFRDALLADQYLAAAAPLTQLTIEDTYCISETFTEAPPRDGTYTTMLAIVTCVRGE